MIRLLMRLHCASMFAFASACFTILARAPPSTPSVLPRHIPLFTTIFACACSGILFNLCLTPLCSLLHVMHFFFVFAPFAPSQQSRARVCCQHRQTPNSFALRSILNVQKRTGTGPPSWLLCPLPWDAVQNANKIETQC